MQNKHFYIAGYLLLIIFLHMNAILKPEDPIADTQTEGISYDQKVEQDKDGVKAPATPKMIYYGGQGFLTRSSLSRYEKEMADVSKSKKKDKFNWSDWWDDKSAEPEAKPGTTALEPLPDLSEMTAGNTDVAPQPIEKKEKAAFTKFGQVPVEEPAAGNTLIDEESLDTNQPQPPSEEKAKSGDDWW